MLEPLPKEDFIELFKSYKATSSMEIKQLLLLHNVKLILVECHRKSFRNHHALEDSLAIACDSFLDALDKFDLEKGTSLLSYCMTSVNRALIRHNLNRTLIKGPSKDHEFYKNMNCGHDFSHMTNEETFDYGYIEDYMGTLTFKEKYIINQIRDGKHMDDIAKDFGCSKQRIYQIKDDCIKKMRKHKDR